MQTTMQTTKTVASHAPGCPCCKAAQRTAANVPLAFVAQRRPILKRRAAVPTYAQATRDSHVTSAVAAKNGTATASVDSEATEQLYMGARTAQIRQHFPTALSVDDFMHRVEMCAFSFGFQGDNTIAMTCLCRDEISATVKVKIDEVFGASFNTNGLGGVMTCGVTGVKAGLSHAPICPTSGKERYIFFAMPHIAIDSAGRLGVISRPGRPGESCACGALAASLNQIKADGLEKTALPPGVHDFDEPELSILKQRLARRIVKEEWDQQKVNDMDLVDITKLANRAITADLEYLISKAVDTSKADYIVITGVEIHNWGTEFDNDSPNLEFVSVTDSYAVIDGERVDFDIEAVPSLTPRQVALLANAPREAPHQDAPVVNSTSSLTTVARSIDAPFLYSSTQELKEKQARAARYAAALGAGPITIEEPRFTQILVNSAHSNGNARTAVLEDAPPAPAPPIRKVVQMQAAIPTAAPATPPAAEPEKKGLIRSLLDKLFW